MNFLKKIVFSLLFGSLPLPSVLLAEAVRIMPLGDSITFDWHYGDIRTDAERSGYRNFLWYKLGSAGFEVDFVGSLKSGGAVQPSYDGDNEGHIGWTSHEIAENVYFWISANPPNIILLHVGTNDISSDSRGIESILSEVDRFEKDNNKSIKVILARIIQMNPEDPIISRFNSNISVMADARIANGDNIAVIDMERGAGIDYAVEMLSDGIHPNSCGYEKMANVWFSALTAKASPGLQYCQSDSSSSSLAEFPYTLVASQYIVSIDIDEALHTVTFVASVPDNGIIF